MTRAMPRGWRRIFHVPRRTPYRVENSFTGIDRAARKGYKQIDLDANITKDNVVVICHWPMFAKDKFKHPRIKYGKHATISQLPLRRVLELRSREGYRIHTLTTMLDRCRHHGLVACIEVKGDHRFQSPGIMQQIKAAADTTGCEVRVMTLQTLGQSHNAAALRLKAAKQAGLTTILLVRGKKPRDWHTAWEPYVDYLRGRW